MIANLLYDNTHIMKESKYIVMVVVTERSWCSLCWASLSDVWLYGKWLILTALSAFPLFQAVVLAEVYKESLVFCRDRVGREGYFASL